MRKTTFLLAALAVILMAGAARAADGNVKVTPWAVTMASSASSTAR